MMARTSASLHLTSAQKIIVEALKSMKDGHYACPKAKEKAAISVDCKLQTDPTLNTKILRIRMNPEVRLNITIKPDSGLIVGKWFSKNNGCTLEGADKISHELVEGLVVDRMQMFNGASTVEEVLQLGFRALLSNVQDGAYKSFFSFKGEKHSTKVTIQTNPNLSRNLTFKTDVKDEGIFKIELTTTPEYNVHKLEMAFGDSKSEIVTGTETGVNVLTTSLRILLNADFSVPNEL